MISPSSFTTTGIAYRRCGSGSPLLLLHGLPGSGASWTAVAERSSVTHDVIVPDLLGFGASAKPCSLRDLHASAQAEALAGLVHELGLTRVAVVGHDFGGPVAVELAASVPERVSHLGLLATNLFPDTPIPFPLSTLTWRLIGRVMQRLLFGDAALRMMLRTGTGRPRVTVDAATSLGGPEQRAAIRTIFAGSLTRLRPLYEPVERHARAIAAPTFVGWGSRDRFFSIAHGERTAAALSTTLRVYPEAGHFLPEERPDEVARDLNAFLTATTRPNTSPE